VRKLDLRRMVLERLFLVLESVQSKNKERLSNLSSKASFAGMKTRKTAV